MGYLRGSSGVRGCSRECEGTVQVAACEFLGLLTGLRWRCIPDSNSYIEYGLAWYGL